MKNELLHGTLEVMILKTLSWGRMHGYGIGRWIMEKGGDALQIEEGSLYPALYRLERKGLIDAEWGLSEKNRKAVLPAHSEGTPRAHRERDDVDRLCDRRGESPVVR
jgi:DNA-binding PadR family transcriptional regulator